MAVRPYSGRCLSQAFKITVKDYDDLYDNRAACLLSDKVASIKCVLLSSKSYPQKLGGYCKDLFSASRNPECKSLMPGLGASRGKRSKLCCSKLTFFMLSNVYFLSTCIAPFRTTCYSHAARYMYASLPHGVCMLLSLKTSTQTNGTL